MSETAAVIEPEVEHLTVIEDPSVDVESNGSAEDKDASNDSGGSWDGADDDPRSPGQRKFEEYIAAGYKHADLVVITTADGRIKDVTLASEG